MGATARGLSLVIPVESDSPPCHRTVVLADEFVSVGMVLLGVKGWVGVRGDRGSVARSPLQGQPGEGRRVDGMHEAVELGAAGDGQALRDG